MGDHVPVRLAGRARWPWLARLSSSARAFGYRALTAALLLLLVAGGFAVLLGSAPPSMPAPAATAAPEPLALLSSLPSDLALANGSLDPAVPGGLVAFELPSGRTVGHYADIQRQGGGLAVAPDGRRAYLLDGPFFHELELPSLRELRSADLRNPINILGTGRVVVVSPDGKSVYVETWLQTGPTRIDGQLGVGQPDGDYGIAIFDVVQGAFVREIGLEPPWCGVAELFPLPGGRLAVLCGTARQLRILDPVADLQVASVGVSGEKGVVSPDGRRLWVVTSSGRLQEFDLSRSALAREAALVADIGQCAPCVTLHRLHLSADGSRLFVPAAPSRTDLGATGQATVVWVVDTTTLRTVAEVRLPTPAFDAAPTPDGQALLVSNTNTQDPNARMTRLLEVATGRELAHWDGSVVGIQIAAFVGTAADGRAP